MVDDAEGHWLAGLTDGEGCFGLYIRSKGAPDRYSIDFVFKIAMRADDRQTLVTAQRILGGIGGLSLSATHRGTNGKPLLRIAVQRKEQISKVIAFFRRYPLRSKKRRDFEVWAEAFDFYVEVIASHAVRHVRWATVDRPNIKVRRPLAGSSIKKFRKTPPELIAKIKGYADRLKKGREYQ